MTKSTWMTMSLAGIMICVAVATTSCSTSQTQSAPSLGQATPGMAPLGITPLAGGSVSPVNSNVPSNNGAPIPNGARIFGTLVGIADDPSGKYDEKQAKAMSLDLKSRPAPPGRQSYIDRCRNMARVPKLCVGELMRPDGTIPVLGGADCVLCE